MFVEKVSWYKNKCCILKGNHLVIWLTLFPNSRSVLLYYTCFLCLCTGKLRSLPLSFTLVLSLPPFFLPFIYCLLFFFFFSWEFLDLFFFFFVGVRGVRLLYCVVLGAAVQQRGSPACVCVSSPSGTSLPTPCHPARMFTAI